MDVKLEMVGSDATGEAIADFEDWVQRERIRGLRIVREIRTPGPNEMGLELTEIIALVGPIATPVLLELVRTTFGWLKMRRSGLSIKLRIGLDTVEIEAGDISQEDQIIDLVSALANRMGE